VLGVTALAIDLGGSHAACALVGQGRILASRIIPADGKAPLASLLPALSDTLHELLRSSPADVAAPSALVLGFCGIVSAREGRVLATNGKFEDAAELNLKDWCRKQFGLPFLIENDARLALLGEYAFGAARDAQDVVMITLGSGVGGAALLGGQLLQSKHGLAGTIGGHIPVVLDGRLCSCGNLGCADAEVSTAVLGEVYRSQPGSGTGALSKSKMIGFAELFQAADAGDKPAQAALQRCLHVWSALTVALIHAYDPEVVVFGGSVLKRAADILPHLQNYVLAHAWTPGRTVSLRAAALGNNAALLGAIPLSESIH
jgi:glucokinase